MRVRFAPSPTGALHIGGVRTALYNYLLAKKEGGTFVLRIEDTDQMRYVEGAEQYVIDALEWLGLEFDESPAKGGPYGPYRQSERKAQGIYAKYAQQLVDKGYGYYAYDTAEELAAEREKADAQGHKFKYDANTRLRLKNSLRLTAAECQALDAEGATKVVRIMIPDQGNITFKDEVRGVVSFECADLDDKVMLKNDGMPTYHLANIVDDYHMKITHVIRGEEWLPSTPLHVLLYEYLGWGDSRPTFAHLPLILKPEPTAFLTKKTVPAFTQRFSDDFVREHEQYANKEAQVVKTVQSLLQDYKNLSERLRINEKKDSHLQQSVKSFLRDILYGKLSKRDGDRLGMPVFPLDWKGATPEESFNGFREWGFLPDAVLNILALLGWNDGTDQELYTKEELIQHFSLERVSSSGARFNFQKAHWFNKQYLSHLENAELVALVQPSLEQHGVVISDAPLDRQTTISAAQLERVAELLKVRLDYVVDFYAHAVYFFKQLDLDAVAASNQKTFQNKVVKKWDTAQKSLLERLINTLQKTHPFEAMALEAALEPVIGDKQGDLLPIFRLGLSGTMSGPGVYDIMAVLGREETITRLQDFLVFCEEHHQGL